MKINQGLVYIVQVPWVVGFLWSPRVFRQIESKGTLSPGELDLVQRSMGLLEHYSNKPDCFRIGAKNIRSQCGEADMDEDQRVIASISMTLCEIATGNHYSIPLECHEFHPAEPDSPRPFYPSARAGAASQCVDALARSTQFWSSYSGYLREMPQLCYAFRRWNEIDLAKNLYQNATLEKIEFIRTLSARDKRLDDAMTAWNEDIGILVTRMDSVASRFDSMHASFPIKIQQEIEKVVLGAQSRIDQLLQQRQKAETRLQEMSVDHLSGMVIAYAGHIETVKGDMVLLARELQMEYSGMVAATRHQIEQILNETIVRWHESQLVLDGIRLLSMQTMQDHRQLTENIQSLVDQTNVLHDQQSLIFSQFSVLSDKTIDLAGMTESSLMEVNNSLFDLRTAFAQERETRRRYVWDSCLIWILERVLHFDSPSAKKLIQIPLFRVLTALVGGLESVLHVGISLLMSTAVVLYFTSRKLVKQVLTGNYSAVAGESLGAPEKVQVDGGSGFKLTVNRSSGRHLTGEGRRGCRSRVSRIPNWLSQPQT